MNATRSRMSSSLVAALRYCGLSHCSLTRRSTSHRARLSFPLCQFIIPPRVLVFRILIQCVFTRILSAHQIEIRTRPLENRMCARKRKLSHSHSFTVTLFRVFPLRCSLCRRLSFTSRPHAPARVTPPLALSHSKRAMAHKRTSSTFVLV